jgi:hypothetical protein
MTVALKATLLCDTEGCECKYEVAEPSPWESRELARKGGWVTKGDKDYCPKCSKNKKLRPSKGLGRAKLGVKPKWQGLSSSRYTREPLELRFAQVWQGYNDKPWSDGIVGILLEKFEDSPPLTPITVANTIIQWLGSHVGQCFLRDVMKDAPEGAEAKGLIKSPHKKERISALSKVSSCVRRAKEQLRRAEESIDAVGNHMRDVWEHEVLNSSAYRKKPWR